MFNHGGKSLFPIRDLILVGLPISLGKISIQGPDKIASFYCDHHYRAQKQPDLARQLL